LNPVAFVPDPMATGILGVDGRIWGPSVLVGNTKCTKIYVTPGFKDKTEYITICIPESSSIDIMTSSVNNQQQYHEKRIKRL
jgi:hypothetical protein